MNLVKFVCLMYNDKLFLAIEQGLVNQFIRGYISKYVLANYYHDGINK